MNEAPKKNKEEERKPDNGLVKVIKYIFVKNAALKLTALILGFAAWLIISVF